VRPRFSLPEAWPRPEPDRPAGVRSEHRPAGPGLGPGVGPTSRPLVTVRCATARCDCAGVDECGV